MELLLYAAAFYAWQCAAFVPAGAVAFVSLGRRVWTRQGPGWAGLSPWPGSRALLLGGFDFEPGAEQLHADAPLARRGLASERRRERSLAYASEHRLETRGAGLHADGSLFLLTASEAHARHLAERLGRLLQKDPAERARGFEAWLGEAFDVEAFRAALAEAERATRGLRWLCNLYFAVAFVAIPFSVLALGGEGGWWLWLPALGVLHLLALAALLYSPRKLASARRSRAERFTLAALFPPALLRMPSQLVQEHLLAFHPVTAARVLLADAAFTALARRQVAELRTPAWERHGAPTAAEPAERMACREALARRVLALAKEAGTREAELMAVPPAARRARRVCPLCLDGFRRNVPRCPDCRVDTVVPPKVRDARTARGGARKRKQAKQ